MKQLLDRLQPKRTRIKELESLINHALMCLDMWDGSLDDVWDAGYKAGQEALLGTPTDHIKETGLHPAPKPLQELRNRMADSINFLEGTFEI